MNTQFPSIIVEDPVLPMYVLHALVEIQLAIAWWVYSWILCSVPFFYMSIFMLYTTLFLQLFLCYVV